MSKPRRFPTLVPDPAALAGVQAHIYVHSNQAFLSLAEGCFIIS